ncbi:MAG: hypothetical protein E7A81_07055 [Clostridiales bacterium]|nr:hypothetical protein [Clostridiales bacterium]
MSPEAEKMLHNFLESMNKYGHVQCNNANLLAFRELEESGMFSKCQRGTNGVAYVVLSTKALHYFEEKEAEERRKAEEQEKIKKADISKKAWDIKLVILSNIVTAVISLLLGLFIRSH